MFIINSIISNFELCLKRPDHQLDLTFMMTFYHVKHQAIKMHMPFFASIQIVTMLFFRKNTFGCIVLQNKDRDTAYCNLVQNNQADILHEIKQIKNITNIT